MSTQDLASVDGAIRLNEIVPDSQFVNANELWVRSCCSQWNECQAEDLYVAIVGMEDDGHDFAAEAISRGAQAVVTERLLAIDKPQIIVDDSRQAFGKICHALAGNPSRRLSTVGVSGSDGKTVTSHLIRSVYNAAQARTGLISSIETDLGVQVLTGKDELNAPELANQLSGMALSGCSHAVIETHIASLAQRCLSGVALDAAVITNIRFDNIGFHGTKENYRRAQIRLLEHLKPSGFAVLNADDPESHFLLNSIEAPVLTVGMKQPAEITARVLERSGTEQTFLIHAGMESAVVRTTIVGDQHIYNCLAAAAVGITSGIELEVIAKGLEGAGNIPGRLERIECGQDFGVWVDSAKGLRQLATAVQSVKKVTEGNTWVVCSIEEGQSGTHRRRMGEIIEKTADRPVITNSRVERTIDYEPFHQVLDGFDDPSIPQMIPGRFKAIEWALSNAEPNDSVIITGCGEKPIAMVGENEWSISDRDVCRAWLYDRVEWGKGDDPPPQIFDINDFR